MNRDLSTVNRERVVRVSNGWIALILLTVILGTDVVLLYSHKLHGFLMALSCAVLALGIVLLRGFFSLQPNEARVLARIIRETPAHGVLVAKVGAKVPWPVL